MKPKNAIIGQYQRLFTEDALKAIAAKAKKSDTGARALRMIVETLLMDLMYEVPSDPTVKQVTIEEDCVTDDKPPAIKRSNEKAG